MKDLIDIRNVTIYKIRNGSTGKSYIGSTRKNVFKRWAQHIKNLNENKYFGDFQSDWNKYNIDVWSFSILEIGVRLDEQYYREQHWIDFYVKENQYNTNKFVSRATKYRKILEMLAGGAGYYQIRDTLNVSVGTICNVNKRYKLPEKRQKS